MSKHTPGPWRIVSDFNGTHNDGKLCSIEGPDGDYLAEVWRDFEDAEGGGVPSAVPPIGTAAANARLMAAAPDLLDAVTRILAAFDAGAFVRNSVNDADPAWAMKALPHLKALADAQAAVEKAETK